MSAPIHTTAIRTTARTGVRSLQTFLPTAPVETVLEAIDADGAAIVHRVVDDATLAALRRELAPALARQSAGSGSGDPEWERFHGAHTRRVTGLANWSASFVDLVQHPLVTAYADHALLPSCGSYTLATGQYIAVGAGEPAQYLHRDQSAWAWFNDLVPQGPEVGIAAMLAVTPFTEANGATRVVVGSHLEDNEVAHDEERAVPAEMAAGSVLLFSGRVVHGAGANRTSEDRIGLHLAYGLGWLRTEENHQLAIHPHVVPTLPRAVRKLLGFEQYDPPASGGGRLGLVDWEDPARFYAA